MQQTLFKSLAWTFLGKFTFVTGPFISALHCSFCYVFAWTVKQRCIRWHHTTAPDCSLPQWSSLQGSAQAGVTRCTVTGHRRPRPAWCSVAQFHSWWFNTHVYVWDVAAAMAWCIAGTDAVSRQQFSSTQAKRRHLWIYLLVNTPAAVKDLYIRLIRERCPAAAAGWLTMFDVVCHESRRVSWQMTQECHARATIRISCDAFARWDDL